MTMKKLIIVLMFCFPVLMINSYSQTKQESIKELFKAMKQDATVDRMFSSIVPLMMNQIKSQLPVDSLASAKADEMIKSTMQVVKDITKKMIDEDMVSLYDKNFSQNEINDYIAFYKSPSGQKLIEVTPEISKDLVMIMMQKYMPEIQKTLKEKSEEMKNAIKK